MKVVPDAYLIANEFNKFFAKVTGSPFVNPQFMQAVSNMQTESLPDINEGMKILIQSLEADLPADSEEMPG